MADINKGIELCKLLHEKLKGAGFFPALTGGLLYKNGERKDIDIVIYRHREQVKFEMNQIEHLLSDCGLTDFIFYGFVTKAKWQGITVDLFNPESDESDTYPVNSEQAREQVAIDCARSQSTTYPIFASDNNG